MLNDQIRVKSIKDKKQRRFVIMTERRSQFQGQLTRIDGTVKISMAVRSGSGSATREIPATGRVTMEPTSTGLCGKQIIQPMVQLKISSKWV